MKEEKDQPTEEHPHWKRMPSWRSHLWIFLLILLLVLIITLAIGF